MVTWNVQLLPDFFGVFSDDLKKKQKVRRPEIARHLNESDYDIVILQEVLDKQQKRRLYREVKSTFPYIVKPISRGLRYSSGIMMCSKFPMQKIDQVIYTHKEGIDKIASKGFTLAEVVVGDKIIQVGGTHLQAGGPQCIKEHQYQDMRDVLRRNTKDKVPQFIAGDMNTGKYDDSEDFQYMLYVLEAKDYPVNDERPYTSDGINTWKRDGKTGDQIDFIFLRPNQSGAAIIYQQVLRPYMMYREKKMDLADHFGIISTVVIQ